MKRFLAFLLALVMLLSLMTGAAGAADEQDLWEQIIAYENSALRKTRSSKEEVTAADYAALSADIAAIVIASDDYTEGTCTYDGTNAAFFWEDANGEPQGYFPSLRARIENGSNGVDPTTVGATETASYATRGGNPDGKDVYVIGPWYGSDTSFTNQYKNEGQSIAKSTGGTYTLYSGKDATIANVAKAMENGAVVIFDSHGTTDYDNALNLYYPGSSSERVYDSVTEANSSYLTLTSGNGLTSADTAKVTGTFGTYYHAFSFQDTEGYTVYCVDGTAIANHMTKNAPSSLLWMAICLGMATDGISTPLRNKGVEVVYGYSESISFDGDYDYEASFWTSMKNGKTVAEAVSAMKTKYGNWDPAYYSYYNYYNTIEKARKYFLAFPVVVSSEDSHPGQRTSSSYGADSLQTVNSTWTLKASCNHNYSYSLKTAPTLSTTGALTGVCSECSGTTTVMLPKLDTTNYTYNVTTEPTCGNTGSASYTWKTTTYGAYSFPVTLAATGLHSYTYTVNTAPSLTAAGELTGVCSECSGTTTVTLPKLDTTNYACTVTTEPTCTANGAATYTWNESAYGTLSFPVKLAPRAHSYISGKTGPTCTEQGYTNHTCVYCGHSYKDTYVDAKGHTEAIDVAVAATCTAEGKTAGKHCSVCGEVLVKQETVTKIAHTYKNGKCTVCGEAEPNYKCDGGDACPAKTFNDNPTNAWYHSAIDYAVEHKLFNGMSATEFQPDTAMTRAMLVQVLWNLSGKPAVTTSSTFTDVSKDIWYANAVAWAEQNKIAFGQPDNTFEPLKEVTREDIAVFFYRYAEKNAVDMTKTSDLKSFVDANKVSGYAEKALKWAVAMGIISGDARSDGKLYLDPQGSSTRAQVASVLMRYIEKTKK